MAATGSSMGITCKFKTFKPPYERALPRIKRTVKAAEKSLGCFKIEDSRRLNLSGSASTKQLRKNMPTATTVAASELCAKIRAAIHEPERNTASARDMKISVSKRAQSRSAAKTNANTASLSFPNASPQHSPVETLKTRSRAIFKPSILETFWREL